LSIINSMAALLERKTLNCNARPADDAKLEAMKDADPAPLFFGNQTFEALSADARSTQRRRINRNFHPNDAHPAHRFLNAVEPGSYIRPHRHADPQKDETFVVLRGAFGLVLFDDTGNVTAAEVMRPGADRIGAHVPAGVFHALVALEPGSVFFEVKAGPYDVRTDKEWGGWSPAESDPAAASYLAKLRALFE
jgi:cupin fold WbuC family metalloprotein